MQYTKHQVPNRSAIQRIVFTDLDGCLLDHFNYDFTPAVAALNQLESLGIPVVCCTSKTYAELVPIRQKLRNVHPFIVENGAAVYVPHDYFEGPMTTDEVMDVSYRDGMVRLAFCEPRSHWLALLDEAAKGFEGKFFGFSRLGDDGVKQVTGLNLDDARRANTREFSEPVQWRGSDHSKAEFIRKMHRFGAKVQQGGRFVHISGHCDKGKALTWLAKQYQRLWDVPLLTIAAGDSGNDVAMLDAADRAVVIRSPVHEPPSLARDQHVYVTEKTGPAGWVEGMNAYIKLSTPKHNE